MPTPYWQELFEAFRRDGRIQPSALYMYSVAPGTYWGDRALPDGEAVLPSRLAKTWGGRLCHHPSIQEALIKSDADVYVVGGYSTWTCRAAMRWLRRNRKRWVLFGERPGVTHRGRIAGRLRRLVLSSAIRDAAAVAAVGSAAVTAYRDLGFEGRTITSVPYYTDTEPFRRRPAKAGQVAGRLRLLFCGQLIARKGVDVLLSAFHRVSRNHPNAELVLAGEGPLRKELEASIAPHLRDRVRFVGFQPIESLPDLFADADLFVLPSRHDGWGVVVNQALAAGLPVVASDAVGAALDFVSGCGTGIVVPAGDAISLANAISTFADDAHKIRRHAKQASMMAAELTLERGVDTWAALFDEVLAENLPIRPSISGSDNQPDAFAIAPEANR
ncbi:MAG: glycosyltransferase family 4 protein [Planctomycetota bacterium]|nr:glycosyltransferase family 4 protein [Planctomycetaceae bacterium]MDQ3329969.1 glycosyltransferase family 4 protein [Planctomycetota bacterium]